MDAVLSLEEEINKFLLSKGAKEWDANDIMRGMHEDLEIPYTGLEKVLEEMCTKGKLEKSYLVVYKGEPGYPYKTLEDIPDMIDNPICEDWEPEEIPKEDVNIVTLYGHVDWKPEDPKVTYWKHPPFVFKEEHRDYVMENFEGNALTWNGGEWLPQDLECLQLGDIWEPEGHDPPSQELLQESREVRLKASK